MEYISPYYVKPIHGTALKAVIEESALMDQFMAMFRKKLELDEQHLKTLIELRASWSVKWREGNTNLLFSPLLMHFENEINHLTQARENLEAIWKEPPMAHMLESKETRRFDPFEMPQTLEELFVQCQESHKAVTTSTGKAELRDWYNTNRSAGALPGMRFPQIDRTYRTHVVAQRQYVEKARNWYKNDMEENIERHQQHAEDMRKLLRTSLCILNDQLSQSLASCSSAVHSIGSFTSTQFIAARHEEFEQELGHALLKSIDYHSYYQDDEGQISTPVFGLGIEDVVAFVGFILDSSKMDWETWPHCIKWLKHHSGIDHMLRLERRLWQKSDMMAVIKKDCHEWPGYAILYIQYALWSGSPLLSISSQQVTQYGSPIKRSFSFGLGRTQETSLHRKMESITKLAESNIPDQVAQLVTRLLTAIMDGTPTPPLRDSLAYASSILAHSKASQALVKDIWQKWDFMQGCPLTVERNIYSESEPKKTRISFLDTLMKESIAVPEQLHSTYGLANSYIGGFVDCRYRIGKSIREARYRVAIPIAGGPTRKYAMCRMEFEGVDMVTHNRIILKMMRLQQPNQSQDLEGFQLLSGHELANFDLNKEQETYSSLSLTANVPGVYYSGKFGIDRCLVIDHRGSDLGLLFRICDYRFSIKTVAMIAKQMISLVEAIHKKNVILSYISLRNFVFKKKKDGNGVLYYIRHSHYFEITDFVLGGQWPFRFIYPHPIITNSSSTGNGADKIHTFLELHHRMKEDLQSIGYVLIYFLRGGSPQHDLQADSQECLWKLTKRLRMNWAMSIERLTQDLPEEFLKFFNHIRTSDVNQPPSYQHLRNLFQDVLEGIGESDDGIFDWNTLKDDDSAGKRTEKTNRCAKGNPEMSGH